MTELVRVERHGFVAELVLDRPSALNALSVAMAAAVSSAASSLDASVRAVVLSSSQERAFCVGADLKERNASSDDDLRAQRPVMRAAFAAVRDLPVPVVAAVSGFALGGGYELALSCDLIVADETAVVGLPETSVGIVPGGGGTQLLGRRAGWAVASDLIFTARRVPAAEALSLRLVDRVVPAGAARSAALELAARIAGNSPVGIRAAKRAMRLGATADLPTALEYEHEAWETTAFSPDRAEGVRAFVEKRPPTWPT